MATTAAPRSFAKSSPPARSGRPDHQHALAGATSPPHRVRANGKKLEHRRLVQRKSGGLADEAPRHAEVLGEGAVAVHTQHLDAHATVRLALAAGDAVAAGEVGHHVDRITRNEAAVRIGLFDHTGELMPHHAG
jgi:hypothetical protein